jgi:pre-rRNA-processing protein TSR3
MHPTIVIRHRRENLKKCSLRGLETRADFRFFTYPDCIYKLPDLSSYVVLDIEGQPLSEKDNKKGLILIDATWRLADKMTKQLTELLNVPKRSIPSGFTTAYPRRQQDCKDPSAGLASIEALYIAYKLLGHDANTILDTYYWKDQFLQKNHF